ncbi:hypothetical protein J6590_012339 [Homalodisca vitripennis]|nr:hypothetical protein J6590_012339 [Homalodisca vitripennis]
MTTVKQQMFSGKAVTVERLNGDSKVRATGHDSRERQCVPQWSVVKQYHSRCCADPPRLSPYCQFLITDLLYTFEV